MERIPKIFKMLNLFYFWVRLTSFCIPFLLSCSSGSRVPNLTQEDARRIDELRLVGQKAFLLKDNGKSWKDVSQFLLRETDGRLELKLFNHETIVVSEALLRDHGRESDSHFKNDTMVYFKEGNLRFLAKSKSALALSELKLVFPE